jgi:hypothetical protein
MQNENICKQHYHATIVPREAKYLSTMRNLKAARWLDPWFTINLNRE